MADKRRNWHEDVFFGIHYDLHANAKDTVLGKDLTPEHLKERLSRVNPDWIQCDCKGHPGYTSWPTEVGSTSPGMVKDMLRITRDVTKELGIKLGMHYSGVYDDRAIELHPDWAMVDEHGKSDEHYTCRLSGYVDELMIPQMIELIDKYDVDGFWVDGENWATLPCWCDRCRKEFTKRTGIKDIPHSKEDDNWSEWLAFGRKVFVEYVARYAEAVHKRKPDCLICSNWMYTVRQPDSIEAPIDYISGDYSWIWGADRAAIEGRVIDSRNTTWDLMCWSFCKSGDKESDNSYPWTMKTPIHLKQEVSEVVALGGAVMLYNVPQRTGWLTDWHHDLLGEIADFCRERKDICFKTKTASEVAVLHLASHYYTRNDPLFNLGSSTDPVEGALHAMLDNQISTDIITETDALKKLENYKFVIVPEQTVLNKKIVDGITAFAEKGGEVLITGAHLARDYSQLAGAKLGEKPFSIHSANGVCLPVKGKAVTVAGDWTTVKPDENTQVLTCHLTGEDVAHNSTDKPVATRRKIGKGAITAVYGPIFESYFHGHYPLLRQYIRNLIETMNIDWKFEVAGPSWLEVVLREKDDCLMINLLNRGAGAMTNEWRPIIDALPEIRDVTIKARQPCGPNSVRLLPEDTELEFEYENQTVTIHVPQVKVHDILAIS